MQNAKAQSRTWTRGLCAGVAALALTALPTAAKADSAPRGDGQVVNPAFALDGTGTANPTGWTTTGTSGASFTEATSYGYNGDAYQLTHWSSAAYDVDTRQRVTGLADGDYTLGAWVKSGGGDTANYIELQSGRQSNRTAVPVISDGSWLHIVT